MAKEASSEVGIVEHLKKVISEGGRVIAAGEEGFKAAVSSNAWNKDIGLRQPGLLVEACTTTDVQETIKAAGAHGWEVSVRSGGHGVHGTSGGSRVVVLDLARMHGVTVDVGKQLVYAQGGARLSDIDGATAPFGLAVPLGTVGHTGVAGLVLGGGVGRLTRLRGCTCDNLVAVHLVDATGAVRVVDDDSDAELMWGLRGAGATLGVVTQFVFQAYPVPARTVGGALLFPPPLAAAAFEAGLRAFRHHRHDPRLNIVLLVGQPPHAPVPMAGVGIDFIGPLSDPVVAAVLAELRAVPGLAVDMIAEMSYLQLQNSLTPLVSMDSGWYGTDTFIYEGALSGDKVAASFAHRLAYPAADGGRASLALMLSHGIGMAPNPRSCFTIPRTADVMAAGGVWWQVGFIGFDCAADGEHDGAVQTARRQAAKAVAHAMKQSWPADQVAGVYAAINNPDEDAEAYHETDRHRLLALKKRVDPHNFFHFNTRIIVE